MPTTPFIAVDVGNSRIKLGVFRQAAIAGLPQPEATLHLAGGLPEFDQLETWLTENACVGELHWRIGSVNRPAASRLIDWLRDHRAEDDIGLLASGDLPLMVKLAQPDRVGIDRLLDGVAANRLRPPGRPVVVVDMGSAITVDLIDSDGAFRGGAILPGIAMSARALHEFTDLLPFIDMAELAEPPPALGTATVTAMRSGLFWGAVGAVRQLVEQLAGTSDAEVFLTGGAGTAVARLMGTSAHYVPHLTLAGIALAGNGMGRRGDGEMGG
jgi:type III pantothenate kinase